MVLVILGSSASFADSVQFRPGQIAPPLAINPSSPNSSDLIRFTTPLDGNVHGNPCGAEAVLGGGLLLVRDDAQHTIEIVYDGNIPMICPRNWAPVIGAEGDFGPLASGDWMLRDLHNNSLRFTVVAETIGDFDGDGLLTVTDIDMLTTAVLAATHSPEYDLNEDALVNRLDHRIWVKDLKHTWFGDASLNGEFDSSDMVQVFTAGKYETDLDASWGEGDWNADSIFDSRDMVKAFSDGGYERDLGTGAEAVPEPDAWLLLFIGLLPWLRHATPVVPFHHR